MLKISFILLLILEKFLSLHRELSRTTKIFVYMQLQIKVFTGVNSMREDQRVFERIIDIHDDLSIPYESLVKDLKFLFGSSCIVSFNVM